jgi:hypothetical protein
LIKITKIDWIGDRESSHQDFVARIRAVAEIKMKSIEVNGIPDDWHEELSKLGDVLCERGDIMLYPGKKTINEANRIANQLVEAIAILAFVKGGIEIFGWHFEGAIDGSSKT